jgi:hypothetical protein
MPNIIWDIYYKTLNNTHGKGNFGEFKHFETTSGINKKPNWFGSTILSAGQSFWIFDFKKSRHFTEHSQFILP